MTYEQGTTDILSSQKGIRDRSQVSCASCSEIASTVHGQQQMPDIP